MKSPIEQISEPSYEDKVRGYACWLESRARQTAIPGVPVSVMLDAPIVAEIAAMLHSHARMMEGAA
jgi:hypothetical protein